MLIQLLKDIFAHKSGTVLDVDAKTASVLINRQQAVEYNNKPKEVVSESIAAHKVEKQQKKIVDKSTAKAKKGRPKKK